MEFVENESAKPINNYIKNKNISGPSNITNKLVKMIPNPTRLLMNPIILPLIIVSILLIYLSGQGDIFLKNPALVAGSLGGLFLIFIIIILTNKPEWQQF